MAEVLSLSAEPKIENDQKMAFYAVTRGNGSPAQQRYVMAAIRDSLCGLSAIEPAKLSERESGFLAGKRWVGIMVSKWSGVSLWQATEEDGPDG
jgi:hypothetical protein